MKMSMEEMMRRADDFNFNDSGFELELNLQLMRRELVSMIDEVVQKDCNVCNRLKCCCEEPTPTPDEPSTSGGSSLTSTNSASIDFSTLAPSAKTLPKPIWETTPTKRSKREEDLDKDVESWVRASTPSAQPNLPEVKRTDTRDGAFSWVSYNSVWTDHKPSTSTAANYSMEMKVLKILHDMKPKKPTFHWDDIKLDELSFRQNNTFNISGNKSDLIPAGSRTATDLNCTNCIVDHGNSSYIGWFGGKPSLDANVGRNAVDAFFRNFRKSTMPTAQNNTPFVLSQLAYAFKTTPKKSSYYTHF
ncbi:uncharacterized protein [Battus philenor]|uniref:uncharacterized protein n=1 Tax=Battus philenor TaxID=42288 RepID=UPI0035CFD38B